MDSMDSKNSTQPQKSTFQTFPRINVVAQRSGLARETRYWYAFRHLYCNQNSPGYFKFTDENIDKIKGVLRSRGKGISRGTIRNVLNSGNGVFWEIDRTGLGNIKAVRITPPGKVAFNLEPYRKKNNLNLGLLVGQSAEGSFHSPISDLKTHQDFLGHIIKNTIFSFSPMLDPETLERFKKYCNRIKGDKWKYQYLEQYIYEGIQVSQKKIGSILGLTRQTVSKYIKKIPGQFLEYSEYQVVKIDGKPAEFSDYGEAQAVLSGLKAINEYNHKGYYVVRRSNGNFQVQERESTIYKVQEKQLREKEIDLPGLRSSRMKRQIRAFWRMYSQEGNESKNTGFLTGESLTISEIRFPNDASQSLMRRTARDINISISGQMYPGRSPGNIHQK